MPPHIGPLYFIDRQHCPANVFFERFALAQRRKVIAVSRRRHGALDTLPDLPYQLRLADESVYHWRPVYISRHCSIRTQPSPGQNLDAARGQVNSPPSRRSSAQVIDLVDGGVRTRTGDLGVMNPDPDLRIYCHLMLSINICNGLQPHRECSY
jgi:hypothetical protein